jgi:cation diffusion facilitator CzcD-associated flavoprotein CzcO
MLAELERIVQQQIFPAWSSRQSAMRDALFHRMHWLAENEGLIDTKLALADEHFRQRVEDLNQRQMGYEHTYSEWIKGLRRAQSAGNRVAVDEYVELGQELADRLPEFWGQKMRVDLGTVAV